MNKILELFLALFIIVLLVVIVIYMLSTFMVMIEDDANPKCLSACEKYGYDYYDFKLGGYGPSQCWCTDDGEPKQVPLERRNI